MTCEVSKIAPLVLPTQYLSEESESDAERERTRKKT